MRTPKQRCIDRVLWVLARACLLVALLGTLIRMSTWAWDGLALALNP